MHHKINIAIWTFVIILLLSFTYLEIRKQNTLQSYQVTLSAGEEVRFYTKNKKQAEQIEKEIKKIHEIEEITLIEKIDTVFKKQKLSTYFIHVGDYVKVGNHYDNGTYQVAVNTKQNTLFRILSLENQVVYSKNVFKQDEFDRIVVIGKEVEDVDHVASNLAKVNLVDAKKIANKKKMSVYWLKGEKEVQKVLNKS